MADPTPAEQTLDWGAIATQVLQAVLTQLPDTTVTKSLVNAHADSKATWLSILHEAALALATKAGSTLREVEEPFFPFIAAFTAPVVAGIFGAEVNAGEFARRIAPGGGVGAASSMVKNLTAAITGDSAGPIEPGEAGAQRIASAAVAAALESTFNAVATEMLSDILPEIGPHFGSLTELPESILRTLGVGRLVRRALTPYVNATCVTPLQWFVNKKYRPSLLGASTIAKQIARNPDDREYWLEQLRRAGHAENNIEALLNDEAKFLSLSDALMLVRAAQWDAGEVQQLLTDQGYDDGTVANILLADKLRTIHTFEAQIADAGVDGFVAGRLDESDLGGFLNGATLTAADKARYTELAASRRIAARRPLSSSEVATLVKAGILATIDYRAALVRENRDSEAVAALELLLRRELDDKATLDELRARQAADHAAEKAARDAAAAARRAAVEAQRALDRRGSEADLEAAAVRGLIPLERVREVYSAKYDADTVAILMDDLAARRQAYIDQQAAAVEARKRAAIKSVNVGQLEQAVLEGVMPIGGFRGRLADLGFPDADAALLADTLAARIDARDAARRARDEAVHAAKIKHIDLGRLEMLVRRGHRSLREYEAVLASLGYDEGARAAMVELLQVQIDDDARARDVRAAAAAAARLKGLSLDQERRAVILGLVPMDSFVPWLIGHGFGVADAGILRDELQADVDEADAARQRRADAETRSQAGKAPLSDVRRAARVGLISVAAYVARLRADGYTADDVAIETDLLSAEIADAAARLAAADAAASTGAAAGLTLSQLAAAVRAGVATIADYNGRALAIGLSPADAGILTETLADELATTAAARRRKAALASEGADRELSRADMERAVRQGLKTLNDYGAWLQANGYTADDGALLVAELATAMHAGDAGDAGGGQ